jgi:uncharacterized membrane protein YcaP (DUF421 family)
MLFDGWTSIGRVVLLAIGAYALIVAALRMAGTQALAKMSAYDFVITIALGSIVATIPLSTGVTLSDGAAVVGTYLGLQSLMRWGIKTRRSMRRLATNAPRLVLWNGALLGDEMRALDVTDHEVRAAVRKSGRGTLAEVQAVVLENDGQWSVIGRTSDELTALAGVDWPQLPRSPASRLPRSPESGQPTWSVDRAGRNPS